MEGEHKINKTIETLAWQTDKLEWEIIVLHRQLNQSLELMENAQCH